MGDFPELGAIPLRSLPSTDESDFFAPFAPVGFVLSIR